MKKIINHTLLITSLLFLFSTAFPADISYTGIIPMTVEASEITPRADQIVWKYRVLTSGTVQKRRWNLTKGYWVDPHWINVN